MKLFNNTLATVLIISSPLMSMELPRAQKKSNSTIQTGKRPSPCTRVMGVVVAALTITSWSVLYHHLSPAQISHAFAQPEIPGLDPTMPNNY